MGACHLRISSEHPDKSGEALVLLFRNAQLGPRRNEKQIKTLYISGGYNCRVERESVFLGLLHKLLCKSTRMEKGGGGEGAEGCINTL